MRDTAEKLTAKHERALTALLSEATIRDAALKCNMNEATIWRFLQMPEFQTRYRAARRQLVEAAISQLQSDCTTAARVLVEVAEDQQAPASARVAAARTILETSIKAVELIDLEERIGRLEETMKGRKVG